MSEDTQEVVSLSVRISFGARGIEFRLRAWNQSSSCCPADVAGLSQLRRARRQSEIQTNVASDQFHDLERGAAQTAKSRGLQHVRASSAFGMQAPQGIGFRTRGSGKAAG